jgi:uncharacterized protein (UPF0548 family)
MLSEIDFEDASDPDIPACPTLLTAGFSNSDIEKVAKKLTPENWLDLSLLELEDTPTFQYRVGERALVDWQHYRFDWIELHRPNVNPVPDQTVGVLARAMGLWVLNACRVVYVIEEEVPLRRLAFAYGTLPEHAESGEERFQVEWHEDESVWYDILAFSRPNQLLSRLAYPYVRRKQKQFARESKLAMKAAVAGASTGQ